MATVLRLAVCLFPDGALLDYAAPIEQLGCLTAENIARFSFFNQPPSHVFKITYLGPTLEPIVPPTGPPVTVSRTYDDVKAGEQFDVLLVPGGPGADPAMVPSSLLEFLKRQEPGAKHILSICTGSWILATAGLLNGKRATSNKSVFKLIKESTKDAGVEWIAKARFVATDDKKIWTSSGITAGMDMTNAFLKYLAGEEVAATISRFVEFTPKEEGEDEFAAYYGLV